MKVREIFGSVGLGRSYFYGYWSLTTGITPELKAVQDNTRSIFIHIPKAAGMSVWKSLYGKETLFGHAPACSMRNFDRKRFDTYTTFSVMRRPEDRFSSAFYFLKNGGLTAQDYEWGQKNLSRYTSPNELLSAMSNPRIRGSIMSWKHFTPQTWYLCDYRGKILVNQIGKVEHLHAFLEEISAKIGVPLSFEQKNKSKKPGNFSYSQGALDTLRKLYAPDYELYGTL